MTYATIYATVLSNLLFKRGREGRRKEGGKEERDGGRKVNNLEALLTDNGWSSANKVNSRRSAFSTIVSDQVCGFIGMSYLLTCLLPHT